MMAPTNLTPLVVFAVIAMIICGVLGMVAGQDPFGPGQEVRAEQARTQLALEVRSTEMAQTPQAMYIIQTAQAADLTSMPVWQTATQAAAQAAVDAAAMQATQTAIAGQMMSDQIAIQATQTALAREQTRQNAETARDITALALGGILVLVLCGWILTRAAAQIVHARAQEKLAQARYLAEHRRMTSVRVAMQSHNGRRPHNPVPNSLMKKTGDIDKLPKAE